MNRVIIGEQYKLLETLENFEIEEFCLVKNIHDNQEYLLQYLDLSSQSITEIDNLKAKINIIKNLANNSSLIENRFPLIKDKFEEDNHIYLIYEKIIGKSLEEALNNQELLTEIEAINYLKYLLESLDLLHSFDLIHQLIKPDNLIIKNGRIIIDNYGKFTNHLSALMVTVTLEDKLYIAPEQIRSKPHISSDIYALGMVIISLVTGKNILTLDEDDTGKIIWSEGVNLSNNFIQLLDGAIAPKISQRYKNCQEVIAEINKLFPQQKEEEIIKEKLENIAHYTPTEIITAEENLDSFTNDTNQEIINPTEFIDTTNYYENRKQETINQTELIFTEEEEDIKSLLPLAEEYLSDNDSLSSDFGRRNNENIFKNQSQESLLPHRNYSGKNKDNFLSKMQTPKGIIISFVVSLLLIFSFAWGRNYLYQKRVENLISEIQTYYEEQNFKECITLINSTTIQSLPIADSLTREFLGKCWLASAEVKAVEGDFAEAINIAVQINNTSPDYNRARQFIDDWSEQLFLEGKILCETNGDIGLVEEKLGAIPESSKWKKEALDLIDNCQNSGSIVPLCPGILCPE